MFLLFSHTYSHHIDFVNTSETLWSDLLSPKTHGCACTCWFSNPGFCPAPWVFMEEFWLPCQTLNPFLLPPSCLSLQRDSSPQILILSGYHSDEGEKSPDCRFRFEIYCCRNPRRGQIEEGQSGKTVSFHCQILEKLPVEGKIHLD